MVPKYNVGDIVEHEGKVYCIVKIFAANWFMEHDPFVYGLTTVDTSPSEPYEGKILAVREGLLRKVTDRDLVVWRVLYGKKRSDP